MQRSGFGLGLTLGLLVGVAGTSTFWLLQRSESPAPTAPATPAAPPAAAPSKTPPPLSQKSDSRQLREKQLLQEELSALRRRITALQADGGEHPLTAENRALRQELRALRATLRTETIVRAAQEGAPIPFPKELPQRYQQEAVLQAVTDALKTAALPGEVRSIDCSEYPCIVYGDSKVREAGVLDGYLRKSADALRRTYPSDLDAISTSYWSSASKDPASSQGIFSLSIYPRPEPDSSPELRRRLRFRQSQYVDSARGR